MKTTNGNGTNLQMDQVKPRDHRRGRIKLFLTMSKTVKKGRDARTGRFIPIKEAERHPDTTVIEKVKVGATKKRK